MNPTLSTVKVDPLLSTIAQKYKPEGLIADMILGTVPVKKTSGKIPVFGKENFNIYSLHSKRAPGSESYRVGYTVSQDTYACTEDSLEMLIPDEVIENADDPYSPKEDGIEILTDNLDLGREVALATAMADTSIMTNNTTLSGTSQWSDEANSDPLNNIRTGMTAIANATGAYPNAIAMADDVAFALKNHPDVRSKLDGYGNGNHTDEALIEFLKKYFGGIEHVFIGKARYNTAAAGQTVSLSAVWGKHFWLFRHNPKPSLLRASFGYSFRYKDAVADQYRDEQRRSDVVRRYQSMDDKIVDANLAYLIKNAIA